MTGQVLHCGYVPLVDCAPLVIASELGFATEEGLDLRLVKQPSWSALRDMLALGHLDAAQMLSPMPVAMSLGIGGFQSDIHALMVISVNGTVFGLSNAVAAALGQVDFGDAQGVLNKLLAANLGELRVGVPFPYSMHHLLLSYWTVRAPGLQIKAVTVPPQRMAEAVEEGQIDAFWVGEPWGSAVVDQGAGKLMLSGRDIWGFAPEKVLAARAGWIAENPQTVRRLMRAVFQAARWLDTTKNKPLAVEILARSEHLNLALDLIDPAITGHLTASPGVPPSPVDHFLLFHKHGANFPWRSQAAWIAKKLGGTAEQIIQAKTCFRTDLYRENLGSAGADLPGGSEKLEGAMQHKTTVASSRGHMILGPDAFFDGKIFDFSTNL